MVTVTCIGKLPSGLSAAAVTRLAELSCRRAGAAGRLAIGVRVVGDAEMRRLNRLHRGKDKVTDVLSFSQSPALPDSLLPSGHPERGTRELGDIIVSLPQVRRQAKAIGRPVTAEFALMIVHGTLHLLGFDHESLADETRMFGLQHDVLIKAGIL